jgi:hypothetical protein
MGNVAYARYENNPVRQEAYRLWSEDVSRSTMSLLPAIEAFAQEKVAYRTVQEWRHRDQWELRYAEEEAAESGVLVIQHVKRLRVAAPTSVTYLDQVARGELPYDRGRVEVSKFLVQEAGKLLAVLPHVQASVPDVSLPSSVSDEELYALAMQGRDADQEE